MPEKTPHSPLRRVLIASNHPLFGQGLRNLLQERYRQQVEIVGVVSDLPQALAALEAHQPDLVVVDYDDATLNREEVLRRLMEGERRLRVVLLSLHSPQDAIVYDRRTMSAAQMDAWLKEWATGGEASEARSSQGRQPEILMPQAKAEHRRSDMKHLVIAGILVIAVTALLIAGLNQVQLLPTQASAQAVPIDNLFDLQFKVIAFLFALIVVFMVYSIVVFRRKPGDRSDAVHIEGNTRLEVAWTVAPLITVMFFAYLGGQSLSETLRADPRALEINVIGRQWSWRFEYPEYGIVSDTLFMPVNKQAILHMSSEDVIHSFWVPEFRVKQDALPGGQDFVRDLRVTPTIIGDYKVRCAELCGLQHAYMEAPVKVLSQADFDAWVAQETGVSDDPVVRGEKWARTSGCIACHSIDGTKIVGPSWKGLFGKTEKMTDGTVVTVDEAYIRESILQPNKLIVEGYPANVMPANYGDQLTPEQIADIIAYIMSLK